MSEQELKLHVPATSRRAVQHELRQGQATLLPLHAMYFDTPTRELARARIALRLRREGPDWIQTVKMPGPDAITRVEINHSRPGPVLDLSVYVGTPLEAPLSTIQGELGLRYETDVQRLLLQVRTREGNVEVAYDTGVLRAGDLELPIAELEFELLSGRPAAIFTLARRWQQRHGLVLDARSKSERGDALATLAQELAALDADDPSTQVSRGSAIARFWGPRAAASVTLERGQSPAQAMSHIAGECLDQVTRNAAMLAEVDTLGVYAAGQPEHVHQLRVAMRRLRSAWRLFDGWISPPPASVQDGIRTHFSAFGVSRDQDVLNETVTPALMKAGMPVITFDMPPAVIDVQALAAGRAFQGWLLDALEWSLDVQPPTSTAGETESASLAASTDRASVDVAASEADENECVDDAPTDAIAAVADAPDANAVAQTADAHDLAEDDRENAGRDSQAHATHAGAVAHESSANENNADDGESASSQSDDGLAGATITPTIIPLTAPPDQSPLHKLMGKRLHRWHAQVAKQGQDLAALDVPARHALRKRGKRLRYGLSFAEKLLPQDRLRNYRKLLSRVQDLLGEINDLAMAKEYYQGCVATHPQAWFALGWISARLDKLTVDAQQAFDRLADTKPFWK